MKKEQEIQSNESQTDKCNIQHVSSSECKSHNASKLTYLYWADWVNIKINNGENQRQCTKCSRWYFECEY